MMRHFSLRRLFRDTEGQALLETVVAFPVLFFFVLVVMELSMLYNAKQLATYSAFCAARTASVNGVGVSSKARTHLAAAMAMSSIASANNDDAEDILEAFGVTNPGQTIASICSIPGFRGDNDKWRARLANAFLRTGAPSFTIGNYGARRNVEARITYIYRCSFLPLGIFWGQSGITDYVAMLSAFQFYGGYTPAVVSGFIWILNSTWKWNIPVHARAVTDYWKAGS